MSYPAYLNQGCASQWIARDAMRVLAGLSPVLDVGANRWPLPGAVPVDVGNREVLEGAADGSIAGIFSSHTLEHIADWQGELRLWHRKLAPGAKLVLYLPHPSFEPWRPGGSWVGAQHVWAPEPQALAQWLDDNGFTVVWLDEGPDAYMSFYVVARRDG